MSDKWNSKWRIYYFYYLLFFVDFGHMIYLVAADDITAKFH